MATAVISQALACLSVILLAHSYEAATNPLQPIGLQVYLPAACSDEADMHFMNDNEMDVHYGWQGRSTIHRTLVSTSAVPVIIRHIMAMRETKDLWISADRRLEYGEAMQEISALSSVNRDLPLHIFDPGAEYRLSSPNQAGSSRNRDYACVPVTLSGDYSDEKADLAASTP